LFFKVGSQVPPALAFILLPWLLRGGEEGTYMALYVDLLRGDRLPDLVLSVGDQDTAHLHRAGHAVVFGVPEPLGALGVVVGDEIVWPAYPPRRGRRYDPRWSPRVADDGR
jgi:hypothetical protein